MRGEEARKEQKREPREGEGVEERCCKRKEVRVFFFKQKTAYEIWL